MSYGLRKNIYVPTDYSEDDWNALIDAAAVALKRRGVDLKPYTRRQQYTASDVVLKALQYLIDTDESEESKNP